MHLLPPPINISEQSVFTLKTLTVACWLATFGSAASAATYTEDTIINNQNPPSQIELGEGVDLVVNEGTLWTPNVTGAAGSTLTINVSKDRTQGTNIYLNDNSTSNISVGKVTLINENAGNENNGKGIYSYNNAHLNVTADTIVIKAHNDGVFTNRRGDSGTTQAEINFFAQNFIHIESTGTDSNDGSGLMNNGNSSINVIGGAVANVKNITDEELSGMTGEIVINGSAGKNYGQAAVANKSQNDITLAGKTIWINRVVNSETETISENNFLGKYGLYNTSSGTLNALGKTGVNVFALDRAVYSSGSSGTVNIYALEGDNWIVQADSKSTKAYAVYASGSVEIEAVNGDNHILAEDGQYAVSANGKSNVSITGKNNYFSGLLEATSYSFYEQKSRISINSAPDGIAQFKSQTVAFSDDSRNTDSVSALYVREGASIDVNAGTIDISTSIAEDATEDVTHRERAVWAEHGTIDLSESKLLVTAQYGSLLLPNNAGAALVAGASNLESVPEADVGTVNATGLKTGTRIFGDLVAGQRGVLNFELTQGNGTLLMTETGNVDLINSDEDITGNALAANGGIVNIEIGDSVVWSGRSDDYQDAGKGDWNHEEIFAPEFSKDITGAGTVNITLNGSAYWNVTGQSWVTSLSGDGGTINLINSDSDTGAASYALHVQNISGQHTFVLNLNSDNHALSDMLYVQNVGENGKTQQIEINSLEGLENMAHEERVRFATVNVSDGELEFVASLPSDQPAGAAARTRTMVRNQGFFDVGFRIESENRHIDPWDSDDESYNGRGDDMTTSKPGEAWVDDHYDAEDAQNWYLVRDKSADENSDGGEAVLATARAAYWNAVEIDRLNKRLGDARHADGGTDGFWVRVRNDRIGTDAGVGDFRSRNYAYQFGYDHTKKEDDGKRLFGAALDYMDGNTTYRNIDGTGATDRFGVTAYMTWFGDDGWYYDVVGKWGVLSNSFRITNDYGSLVDGDYDNHVLGASFEFGRKLTKENSLWFLEPQAQIQHVMVTEASYSTNQGTHVDQDKINSTITRLGFRIGRNFGEQANGLFYAKADWLKEWHGHQRITVTDITTGNRAADASIDNKGNWFDVGLGVQSPISDTTYFFADAEYVFGNHLDNTWNFNAGVRWMFH